MAAARVLAFIYHTHSTPAIPSWLLFYSSLSVLASLESNILDGGAIKTHQKWLARRMMHFSILNSKVQVAKLSLLVPGNIFAPSKVTIDNPPRVATTQYLARSLCSIILQELNPRSKSFFTGSHCWLKTSTSTCHGFSLQDFCVCSTNGFPFWRKMFMCNSKNCA